MKLVLACTAVVLLMSAVELARSPRGRKNAIQQMYSDANATVPEEQVDLYYGDYEVTLGDEVRPENVQGELVVGYDYEPGCYYAVIKYTPDFPSSNDSFLSPYLLGMSVNNYYSSDGCEESCEIATWLGPSPAPGTGVHRYIVEVYKQYGMIDTSDSDLCSYQTGRENFSPAEFARAYDLRSTPVAGCMYTSLYPYSDYY